MNCGGIILPKKRVVKKENIPVIVQDPSPPIRSTPRRPRISSDEKYIIHEWVKSKGFAGFNTFAKNVIKGTNLDSQRVKIILREIFK